MSAAKTRTVERKKVPERKKVSGKAPVKTGKE